jgi:hypothetical protein
MSGPSNVDISDIHRYGYKSWYIVKDGQAVRENFEGKGKSVSAKPRNVIWDRIGTWNYTRSVTKTNPLIKVKLDGSVGTLVKLHLALRFQFGGRVKGNWTGHPELKNKGRYLRRIRIIPSTRYVSQTARGGYTLNARVTEVKVRRIGSRTDPVAEAKLKVKIEYGRKQLSRAHWYTSEWEITVKGTGHHKARKLRSTSPSRANSLAETSEREGDELSERTHDTSNALEVTADDKAGSLIQTESLSSVSSGPPNPDIADIRRYGYKSWYIVKDGQSVRENFEGKGKYVSAKPRNVIWDRIGTWNYTRSVTKTNSLIKVKLDGSAGALVKLHLGLWLLFGGRVNGYWTGHPEL